MRQKVLFASDFDGTFYFEKGPVVFHDRDLEAISRFQKAGGMFGVCTGRSLSGVTAMLRQPIDFDFYILSSGALILDREKQIIHQENLRPELLWQISQRFLDRVDVAMLMGLEKAYVPKTAGSPIVEQVHSLQDIADKPLFSLSLITPSVETAADICATINACYADEVIAFENTTNVDLCPLGCSKGKAVRILKEHYGADITCGIGDSYNDIPLLDSADWSFTFNRSPEPVRQRADTLVDYLADALDMAIKKSEL